MNKNNSRKALGRGLSYLIPVTTDDSSETTEIYEISITSIKTNPFQPRIDFDESDIAELAKSIKTQGLLQPVVVRKKDDYFEIISGERRFRAFKYLKKDTIPCLVKSNITDREMLELALIENIQREELNEIEKAVAYRKLLIEYNYTHEKLSEQIGKSRTAITNSMRLLNLPEEIQQMVRQNQISMGHARALLSLDPKNILEIAHKIIIEHLSVRDVESITNSDSTKKGRNTTKNEKPKEKQINPDLANIINQLNYKFGTPVSINDIKKKKGTVCFEFFGEEDLSRIIDILLK